MSRPVLDVTEWWVVASDLDEPVYEWPLMDAEAPPPPSDCRPNAALEAFFAEPLPEPAKPAANLRHNPDLEAMFA